MKKTLFIFIASIGFLSTLSAQESDQKETFTIAEEKPSFPGGTQAMYSFIAININYPKEARDQGAQGKVLVAFVIDKDGSIDQESLSVLKNVNPYLDQEAMRVIGSMPNWSPGKNKGEPVRVKMVIPVLFRLGINPENEQKKKKKKKKRKKKEQGDT